MIQFDAMTENLQRKELGIELGKCTHSQQRFFRERAFPLGVPADKIRLAYDLVQRTLTSNMAKGKSNEPKEAGK
jgi:hypothetical protein